MFVLAFERPLLRLSVKTPVFAALFQLPPRMKAALKERPRAKQDHLAAPAGTPTFISFPSKPPVKFPSSTAKATR